MIRPENFIYFLTVCGFFVGLIFSVLSALEPLEVVWCTILITVIFYIIALAGSGYFIKYIDIKSAYDLNRDHYEVQLEKVIGQIEKREYFLKDSQKFIRNLEEEILAQREVQNESV